MPCIGEENTKMLHFSTCLSLKWVSNFLWTDSVFSVAKVKEQSPSHTLQRNLCTLFIYIAVGMPIYIYGMLRVSWHSRWGQGGEDALIATVPSNLPSKSTICPEFKILLRMAYSPLASSAPLKQRNIMNFGPFRNSTQSVVMIPNLLINSPTLF